MPNPFVRTGGANTSKTDVDRPVALTPVPERVAGDVFAYRGMEPHGVEPTATYEPPQDYSSEVDEHQDYESEIEPETPVPVYVVQRGGRELRRFRATRAFASENTKQPSMVVGGDSLRRKVTIVNMHATDAIWVGHDQNSASPMHGFPVAAGQSWETDSNDSAIWAVSNTVNLVALAVKTEYVVLVGND